MKDLVVGLGRKFVAILFILSVLISQQSFAQSDRIGWFGGQSYGVCSDRCAGYYRTKPDSHFKNRQLLFPEHVKVIYLYRYL